MLLKILLIMFKDYYVMLLFYYVKCFAYNYHIKTVLYYLIIKNLDFRLRFAQVVAQLEM